MQLTTDYYDLNVLKRATGGDPAFMKHMIQLFIEQAPLQYNEMKTAFEEEDWEALAGTAHKIKSSIRSMGLFSLEDLALDLEQNAKEKAELTTIPEKLTAFEEKLAYILELLSKEIQ